MKVTNIEASFDAVVFDLSAPPTDGKAVTVEGQGTDQYGRTLGTI